ncbi:hypothetical protein INS49_013959 [Diaporthe citri]|uniref:uncharacterized protein n=1 Tax=Diaporthe citri TaxID=83186 RepID=UPI001C8179E1|nr:uncharacterized protein INS49_013959 [Diaporthe citri]KAG6358075.1 hypothetical protein INS49_013959 [Diaporthe citri]
MAAETRDNLGGLPTELFCLVVEDHGLSTRDLGALAATCRKCYTITNPILYQKHIKEEGSQALMWAVERKRFKTMTRFLENGADINNDRIFREYVDQDQPADSWPVVFDWHPQSLFTPLALAAALGLDSMVAFLLDHGADIEKPGKGLCRKIIDYLLDNKLVDINEGGYHGLTPMHLAFYKSHYSLVDMYIDRGADINAVWNSDDGGWTIFGMACLRDDLQRASDLLRRGADPDLILEDQSYATQWTPLGLIYGNLYTDYIRMCGNQCIVNHATDTRARRRLEEQIIQARIDKALQQQREENTD